MNNIKIFIVYLSLVNIFLAQPGHSEYCMASGGPGKGLPCIFPFKYNDVEYNVCTNANKHVTNNKPWCSTLVDGEGNHIGGKGAWGNCDESCPLQKSEFNSRDTCECVSPFQCKWSMRAMSKALMLPRNHPKIKEQTKKIQEHICDIKSKLVFCCGPEQQPPAYLNITNNPEDDYYYEYQDVPCSSYALDGFSCVPSDQCTGLLGVRGSTDPTCEDASHTCCHRSRIASENKIENDGATKSCSAFANEGYKCVPYGNCKELLTVKGNDNFDYYDNSEPSPTCEDPSQICCHQDRMKNKESGLPICPPDQDVDIRSGIVLIPFKTCIPLPPCPTDENDTSSEKFRGTKKWIPGFNCQENYATSIRTLY